MTWPALDPRGQVAGVVRHAVPLPETPAERKRLGHDARNLLAAVLGFAELLELEELSGPQRECIRGIVSNGEQLLTVIDELAHR